MDVPLVLIDIGIRHGLKGYTRKSSTFSLQADVVGLSVFIDNLSVRWLLCITKRHKWDI